MTKLIFTDQNHAGQVYELTLEKTTVGRGGQNTLVIPDASLSAVHCEIHLNGPEVIVRDLGSRNGTFVNGARLANQQAQLKSGQTVRFGSVEARLELDDAFADDTVSEITAVHAMGRLMREQKRERAHPKPADASRTLESSDSGPGEEGTVIALPTAPLKESAVTAPPAPAGSHPRKLSMKSVLVIAVVLVLVLVALLWKWLNRP